MDQDEWEAWAAAQSFLESEALEAREELEEMESWESLAGL